MTINWFSASVLLLFGMISFGYCNLTSPDPSHSSVDLKRVESDQTQALEMAFRVASRIPVNPHVSDRSKAQYEVLQNYLALGLIEEAAKMANKIINWRRGILYTDAAEYYARRKDEEKMNEYLALASEFADSIEGFNAGWQKQRVIGRIATVLAIAGLFEKAKEMTLKDPGTATLGVREEELVRIHARGNHEEAMKELKVMEDSKHWEVHECVAKVYLRILKSLGKDAAPERSNTIRDRFYAVVKKLPALKQLPLYCSFSRIAFEIDRKDLGKEALDTVEGDLNRRKLDATFDIANLVELANVYDKVVGESKIAESTLNRAKELLSKSEFLPSMKRVNANLALAVGYAGHANRQQAWHYFRQALKIANEQKNGRPRALAVADVCTAIARSSLPLPTDVKNSVKTELDRRVTVW